MALRLTFAWCLVLLAGIPRAEAGWIHEVHEASNSLPAVHTLRYDASSDVGTPTFAGVLDTIAVNGDATRLDLVVLHTRMLEADFQQELFVLLETSAPRTLDDARRSSGNHDNPALLALQRPLRQAVSDSRVVADYREELARHHLRIADVQIEKLTLDATEDARRLRCFLWLTVLPM